MKRRDFLKLGGFAAALLAVPSGAAKALPLGPSYFATAGGSFYAALLMGEPTDLTGKFYRDTQQGVVTFYDQARGYFETSAPVLACLSSFVLKRSPGAFDAELHVCSKADHSVLQHVTLARGTGLYIAGGITLLTGLTSDMYFKVVCTQHNAEAANGCRPTLVFVGV